MSIIAETDKGWFLDHKSFIDTIYASCKSGDCESANFALFLDERFFDLEYPFMMDSQFAAKFLRKSLPRGDIGNGKPESASNPSADQQISQLEEKFKSATGELVEMCKKRGFLHEKQQSSFTNNGVARQAAAEFKRWCDEFSDLHIDLNELVKRDCRFSVKSEAFMEYNGGIATNLRCCGSEFIVPAECRFSLSDVNQLEQLVELKESFDFIVLDPPWANNKSVKRKKSYVTLDNDQIMAIPIEILANDGCVVAVWVTNNSTLLQFTKTELFPAWKLQLCATWHWIKVTTTGELICDMDSLHKKPYEHLVIGQKCPDDTPKLVLKDDQVICSVPSSIHSHKPPLQEIMQCYLKPSGKFLEIFARYLLPGWTSWGNEVWTFSENPCPDIDPYM